MTAANVASYSLGLRLYVYSALEKIELTVKAKVSYIHISCIALNRMKIRVNSADFSGYTNTDIISKSGLEKNGILYLSELLGRKLAKGLISNGFHQIRF